MIEIASEKVSVLLPDETAYAHAYAVLPAWRRRRCDRMQFPADRFRSVAVWLLLERLVAAKGLVAAGLPIVENGFGKPDFASEVGLHFSLSHAEDRALAVLSDVPVGCDVERIVPVQLEVARSCLAEDELRSVNALPEGPERDLQFCRLWVRKESYLKAVGSGLSDDLASQSFLDPEGIVGFDCRDLDFGDGSVGAVSVAECARRIMV